MTGKQHAFKDVVTIKDGSDLSGYSQQHLRRLVRQRVLSHRRIGNIILLDLDELLAFTEEARSNKSNRIGPRRDSDD